MDFGKLKDFAKTAVDKTVKGVSTANDIRKRAAQEVKIKFGNETVRKTVEGKYYLGFYSQNPTLYTFEGFEFSGSTIIERTQATGKTTQKGRTGRVLGGAAIGTVIAPGIGTVIGGMAGGAGNRKGTVASSSVTIHEEKPGAAKLVLRDDLTGQLKIVKAKLTQTEANNVERFFK